jgi:arylformamidase
MILREKSMPLYVDLSHIIDPKNAGRKFELRTIGANEVNSSVVRLENQWYIMHDIAMVSHIATHIEVPYHILKDGADLAQIPLETLCGEAVVLNLSGLTKASPITQAIIEQAAEKAGGIRPGDIVLCNLGYAGYYGQAEYQNSPYFLTEAIEYLATSGMKMMGVDAGGVEIPRSEEHINHLALLKRGIPLIENVNNLDMIPGARCKVYAFPLAVKTLESFPLRVVAVIE